MKHTQPKDELKEFRNGLVLALGILLIEGIFLRKSYFGKVMGVV